MYKDSNSRDLKLDFPKGKQNQNETELKTACREVYEEIGKRIDQQIKEDEFITIETLPGKIVKLFLVQNVDDSIPLQK